MTNILNLPFGESPIEPTTPQELVASNLYRTFWYAQGEPVLDNILTNLMVGRYARTWDDADWDIARKHVGDFKDPAFQQLGMPRTHVDPRGYDANGARPAGNYHQVVRGEFEQRWSYLGSVFAASQGEVIAEDEANREKNLSEAETRMMLCDFKYNTDGRSRRFSSNGDPHQSMYRTYVLEGELTGSEELDAFLRNLGSDLLRMALPRPQLLMTKVEL